MKSFKPLYTQTDTLGCKTRCRKNAWAITHTTWALLAASSSLLLMLAWLPLLLRYWRMMPAS
jgi:hypothetical protein